MARFLRKSRRAAKGSRSDGGGWAGVDTLGIGSVGGGRGSRSDDGGPGGRRREAAANPSPTSRRRLHGGQQRARGLSRSPEAAARNPRSNKLDALEADTERIMALVNGGSGEANGYGPHPAVAGGGGGGGGGGYAQHPRHLHHVQQAPHQHQHHPQQHQQQQVYYQQPAYGAWSHGSGGYVTAAPPGPHHTQSYYQQQPYAPAQPWASATPGGYAPPPPAAAAPSSKVTHPTVRALHGVVDDGTAVRGRAHQPAARETRRGARSAMFERGTAIPSGSGASRRRR